MSKAFVPSALCRIATTINAKVQNDFLRSFMLSMAFNTQVKFAGTSGISIKSLTAAESVVEIKNRSKVQNHIKGVHACAMAILAESATGMVFSMNVSDNHIPLLKSMKVNYVRRSKGGMKAVAALSEEQRALITSSDKGDILVPVRVTDESGECPIECEMVWAWVPKKKASS